MSYEEFLNPLSLIAFCFGALGVWLTIKENIWCWPFSLISVIASMISFYQARLFGDMCLQVFYFFAGLYGWVYWSKQKQTAFSVEKVKLKFIPLLLIATIAQTILYYFLLLHFGGDRPLLDALLTAGSLTATYMMTKKWVENWATWVLIDGAYILLYGLKAMWLFALLYLLFTIMAFYGWQKWRKEAA